MGVINEAMLCQNCSKLGQEKVAQPREEILDGLLKQKKAAESTLRSLTETLNKSKECLQKIQALQQTRKRAIQINYVAATALALSGGALLGQTLPLYMRGVFDPLSIALEAAVAMILIGDGFLTNTLVNDQVKFQASEVKCNLHVEELEKGKSKLDKRIAEISEILKKDFTDEEIDQALAV